MATPEHFDLVNMVWKGNGDNVRDLPTMRLGPYNVSLWRLTQEELKEVMETGCVMLNVITTKGFSPVFVGSIGTVQEMIFATLQGETVHTQNVAEVPKGCPLQTTGVSAPQAHYPTSEVRDADAPPGGGGDQRDQTQDLPRGDDTPAD